MKKIYVTPSLGSIIIPYTFMAGTVSTGTSNLPAGGTTTGGATGGIGSSSDSKKV